MPLNIVDIPMYMDKDLILNLYSILISGYIESRSIKCTRDRTDNLKLQNYCKDETGGSVKKSNNDKEKNISKDSSNSSTKQLTAGLDDKSSFRNEVSVKRIYAIFEIFNNLKNVMTEKSILNYVGNSEICNIDMLNGQCAEIEGKISTESTFVQINTITDMLEAYDTSELNKLLEEKSIINYSSICKELKNISSCLVKNNTANMVIQCNEFKTILNVNLNNFLSKNSYIYDNVNCNCKFLCKIIKTASEDESIDLLSKTCMSGYYSKFIENIYPYMDILEENNILLPKKIITKIKGPAIQAIPIAIYL